jgi:apolipoprotein D and lipocalin family protein
MKSTEILLSGKDISGRHARALIFLINIIGVFLITMSMISCKEKNSNLETVKVLDINKYVGVWYEIARLPNGFEKGLECVTATYSIRSDGKIEVINKGHLIKDHSKNKQIKGVAWIPDSDNPAKLKVQFFWPFSGKYWVLALDKEYKYALVGDPSRKYLWILSKTKALDDVVYNSLMETAKSKGFDIHKIELVAQTCN